MDFETYLEKQNLSSKTITNHIKNYYKLENIFGENFQYELNDIDLANELSKQKISTSQKLTISQTLSKYLQYHNLPNDAVVKYIFDLNDELKKYYIERNKALEYPYNKSDLLKELNKFYNDKKYKNYIVSYLLIKLNTRNKDIDLKIVEHSKYANDKENFLIIRKNSIIYLRNDYKTNYKNGTKKNEIKHSKFYDSVVKYYNMNKSSNTYVKLFDTFSNSSKSITKFSTFNLKESDIVKIMLQNDNTLHSATKISKNRGTSLATLENSYNISKK